MAKAVVESFLVAKAAKLSGLTPSMLDYLCRQKVLVPAIRGKRGRGNPRKYSFGDVVMLRALAQLLAAGVSVQRLKKAIHSLRPLYNSISRESLPSRYLVTDGSRVFLQNKGTLLDLDGTDQMSFVFVLELESLRRDVLKMELKGYANGRL
jgi:DNA-binding transcriptional MerR regulator